MVVRNRSLAEQVRSQILEWIRTGVLGAGDGSLPSESEIAEQLAISRATVREALSQLEYDRIIIRRQGSGTYINPTVKQLTLTIKDLNDPKTLIELHGFRPKIGFQEVYWKKAGEEAATYLNISPEESTLNLSVLYLASDSPAIWLSGIIPTDLLSPETDSLPPFVALSQFTEQVTGYVTTHSVASIEAVEANEELAGRLSMQPGQALLCLTDIHLTDYGRPTFYTKQFIVPGIIRIRMLRDTNGSSERLSVW